MATNYRKKYLKKKYYKKTNYDRVQDKMLKKLCQKELKSYNSTLLLQPTLATTYYFDHLSPITQGDGRENREGVMVNSTSLKVRFKIRRNDWDPLDPDDQIIRIFIVKDKDANNTAPPATGVQRIFEGADTDSVYPSSGLLNRQRYKMLYDKTFIFNVDSTENTADVIHIEKYLKLGSNIYYSQGETIPRKNSVYIGCLIESAGQTNNPIVEGRFQLRFKEA